ncbi:MAG: hypothetical protein ACYTAF_06110, partial [Planctomycetota bacterium]
LRDFNRAAGINPNDAVLLLARGILLVHVNKPKEALADLEKAVRLNPGLAAQAEPWIRKAREGLTPRE